MITKVIGEYGFDQAMLGISLSREQPVENMPRLAVKLAHAGSGHSKFLESIAIYIDVTAPRYFLQQLATYRVGTSTQSGSSMYNILKRPFVQDDFEQPIEQTVLDLLNDMRDRRDFMAVKNHLPEGYLQRRIIATNYKAFQNMYLQRKNHKLKEWQSFLNSVLSGIEHPEYIVKANDEPKQTT